ncbi:MAG: metal ABC transporter permease [Thermovirgaceae bacterium]|nr:metal ABC transporter permease [Thermovirgaceae bacterium]
MTEPASLYAVYRLIPHLLPFSCLEARFMQQAFVALVLLAPMTAAMGVQVVNFRMAFFSDAISHSAFAGVALGLIFSLNPHWTMPIFGLLVGVGIMAVQRNSSLSSDTVIGVFFSAVIAFGLAAVSRDRSVARDLQRFLFGDILTIGDSGIIWLFLLFLALVAFQAWSYNRLLYIGISPALAKAHGVNVAAYQYVFAGLLSLVVMISVWATGVLLVTAMLIVPAAAARNLSRSAGAVFWWALLISLSSAVAGLLISAQEWARTATGATVILTACGWFIVSALWVTAFRRSSRIE